MEDEPTRRVHAPMLFGSAQARPTRRASMVWRRMGLLDDAIREHLELKRRRGADPGEVAREESDALGPVQREAGLDPSQGPGLANPDSASLDPDLDYEAVEAGDAIEARDVADDEPLLAAPPGPSTAADPRSMAAAGSVGHDQGEARVAQETVEIDMHSELRGGSSTPAAAPASPEGRSAPVGHPAHTKVPDEESLEWEVPTESGGDPAGEPASAVDAGSGAEAAPEDAEGDPEDVLEETPDFLRETPEQERLWFEQRPPRDFDFNE